MKSIFVEIMVENGLYTACVSDNQGNITYNTARYASGKEAADIAVPVALVELEEIVKEEYDIDHLLRE